MNNSENRQEIPSKFDVDALSQFFTGDGAEKLLEGYERQLWTELGMNRALVDAKYSMMEHVLENRRVQWACISAESQRTKKSEKGISYECRVFQDLTTIQPRYDRDTPFRPPDNTGNRIHKFSKRSRKRLMNRARRLNKSGLPLPYFVTLTYHKNMKDPALAKKHLNVFLQRWRRLDPDGFAYFWKMEPQKRGAVHFHLAMFVSKPLQRELRIQKKDILKSKGKEVSTLQALREVIQDQWAEVTKDIDGVPVPLTRIDYIRKRKFKDEKYRVKGCSRTVKTRCANPRVEYKMEPDFEHRFYGTNVREVDNWKMFMGYMFKYMEKEIRENPFGEGVDTGRFWGFSYNLDFEALKIGMVDHCELENVNDFCNALNAMAFASLTQHLVGNAKRKREALKGKPKALERALAKYRAIYTKQKKRYLMQRDKINQGYGLQFEIKSELALKCEQYLKSKSVNEFFQFEG